MNIDSRDVLLRFDWLDDFKGGMVENYVANQLTASGYPCYDWKSERGAEVDFVIQRDGSIIPLEVKSADNPKAKSLASYIGTQHPDYAIKLTTQNFGYNLGIKSMPLYAAFCI